MLKYNVKHVKMSKRITRNQRSQWKSNVNEGERRPGAKAKEKKERQDPGIQDPGSRSQKMPNAKLAKA